jgi:gamma-glutamyltranspeptidase/glutathione hydrolase
MAPAIAIADTGYPISEKRAAIILEHLADLQADSNLAQIFLQDGLPPAPGFFIKQPKLAKLFRFLSGTRLTNFYYPPIGPAIARSVQAHGGALQADDLTHYRVKDRKPVTGTYKGYEITTLPPPAGGTALLEILKLVEPYDLKSMGFLSADYVHTLATASRQALTDMDAWISDPDFNRVPVEPLLSTSWLDSARSRMRTDTISDRMLAMDSIHAFGPGNTTHLVIVDSLGNLVSLTQSINYFFGSGVIDPGRALKQSYRRFRGGHHKRSRNCLIASSTLEHGGDNRAQERQTGARDRHARRCAHRAHARASHYRDS